MHSGLLDRYLVTLLDSLKRKTSTNDIVPNFSGEMNLVVDSRTEIIKAREFNITDNLGQTEWRQGMKIGNK